MLKPAIMVLDCGATNVRAMAVDENGCILASHSLPNNTEADPNFPSGLVWNPDSIWKKLSECTKIITAFPGISVRGITVTTFGVDGALVKEDGEILYPPISWACNRTVPTVDHLHLHIDPGIIYQLSGLQPFHYNTIFKLLWLKENQPELLADSAHFLFMPSIFLHKLSGKLVTDVTMAGTSMLTDFSKRSVSDLIFSVLGLSPTLFPELVEAGTNIGPLLPAAAVELGLEAGIPVISAGHDTQFAILGSGTDIQQPVLSSGTWEILMARTPVDSYHLPSGKTGITTELDAVPGLLNPGMQWVASGVLEWVARLFYPANEAGKADYELMISEAEAIKPGSNGLKFIPELFEGGVIPKKGTLTGLRHDTVRAQVYRSAIEALSCYLRHGLESLEKAGDFKAKSVICVGGGSKNRLWNQVRADILGIPVETFDLTETTVIGAAFSAMPAAGMAVSLEEALSRIRKTGTVYLPGVNHSYYNDYYKSYRKHFKN